jgi:hypothetical protein
MAASTDPPANLDPEPAQAEGQAEDQALRDLAALTPAQLADEIRADAAEVYTRAQAWRRSPEWTGDKHDRSSYDTIAAVKAELDALPEPATHQDVHQYVKAVGPVLSHYWWTDQPGPRHDLHQAIEQLRRTAMHRIGWAANARRILGLD